MEQEPDKDYIVFTCGHTLHLNCYMESLSKTDKITQCPLCRKAHEPHSTHYIIQQLRDKLHNSEETERILQENYGYVCEKYTQLLQQLQQLQNELEPESESDSGEAESADPPVNRRLDFSNVTVRRTRSSARSWEVD
jgi:DNA repair exonuclease SbcCD ATPase subunit